MRINRQNTRVNQKPGGGGTNLDEVLQAKIKMHCKIQGQQCLDRHWISMAGDTFCHWFHKREPETLAIIFVTWQLPIFVL